MYHATQARPVPERAAFLAAVCAGDAELQHEVESLLAQPSAPVFFDGTAHVVAAQMMNADASVLIGRQLGAYHLTGRLGSGGMGEVFRARDTRLGRDVAIKILPQAFTTDRDRLARFEREARVLASLNHPHIAAIYGVEEKDGVRALVLELVEGPTLAERITRGPVGLDEALPIARQIADALEAAHELGVIHRDLKPANINLRPDGTIKVLDFGLAKTIGPELASGDLTNSPTLLNPETRTGVILGTAAYMAPEQAKGAAVDRRADVWAFGCVLFELLTGTRAFPGDDISETLAAVLRGEPDWNALPRNTPASIRRLLHRALIKNHRERLADMSTVRLEIDDAMRGPGADDLELGAPTTGGARRKAVRRLALAGAAVAAVALAAAGGYGWRPKIAEKSLAFSILPPEGTSFVNAMQGGAPAVSPDGHLIAFVAEGSGGALLWVRSVDAFDARPLPGTEGAGGPFWSPDGRWLAFVAGGSLKKVGLAGEPPQVLASAQVSSQGALAGAWNSDGRILFYSVQNTLLSVAASGGDATPVTARNFALFDENHYGPAFLPDGRHFLLLVRGGAELQLQVYVGELGSNERRVLLKGVTNAQYAPPRGGSPGHLLFVRDRKLMAQPFDAERLTLTGTATMIAEGVAVTGGGGLGDFSVSPSGVLAFRRAEPGKQELAWYDRAGKQVGAIGDRPGSPRSNVRLSRDGKWAAFTRQGEASQDVWIADLLGGEISRFTLNGGRTPVWSPDGSFIAFLRQDTIYRKAVRGGGEEAPIWSGAGMLSVNDWSGDGRYLLITRWDSKAGIAGRGTWLLPEPMAEPGKHEPVFLETGIHAQFVPALGPPRWVGYDGSDGTSNQVFVRTMPGGVQGKWQISTDGGNGSRWRSDGRELYFIGSGYRSVVAVDVSSESTFQRGALRPLFAVPRALQIAIGQYALGYDVTQDGQRFLTTFPSPETSSPAINIVINWQAALGK